MHLILHLLGNSSKAEKNFVFCFCKYPMKFMSMTVNATNWKTVSEDGSFYIIIGYQCIHHTWTFNLFSLYSWNSNFFKQSTRSVPTIFGHNFPFLSSQSLSKSNLLLDPKSNVKGLFSFYHSYPTWCCDANDIVMNTVIIIRYTIEPHMYSKLCKSW